MNSEKSMKNMTGKLMRKNILAVCCTVTFALFMALNLSGCTPKVETEEMTESLPQQSMDIPMDDSAEIGVGADNTTVNIPADADMDKMVSVSVENLGRANPFLPPGEPTSISKAIRDEFASIPRTRLEYDVIPPSEDTAIDTTAKRVASTKVSGIMYDKNSPSAILNIGGSDYFVRSGDVINGYKVLSITKSTVTVQMGANVYKAGIGQLLDEGNNGINYNQVANLSSKFGGAGRK